MGGRLALFQAQWHFSPWAHSIISTGLGWKWRSNPPKLHRFYQQPTPFLREYVADLLARKVVKPVKSISFQGRLFCVPKKDSAKKRVILDLSVLNKYIQCDRFQMLTIAQIRTLLPRGAYAISIDLTDAYWHIPIARHFSPYLGFALGRKVYAFRTMPFGLNIAPRVFTKLTETVLQLLRKQGVQVAAYLDDWLIWAQTFDLCLQAAHKVISFLQSLGFQINYRKSSLVPQQSFTWLGLHWDLSAHRLSLPAAKRKEIAQAARVLVKRKVISRRHQERVMGSLQFASVVDPILRARLKDMSRVWLRRANPCLRDKLSSTPRLLCKQLKPWTKTRNLSHSIPLLHPPATVTFHTDASLAGWGGHTPTKSVQGRWSGQFQSFHINILEAMAVFLTLKRINPKRGSHIRLMLDSNTIVHCINRNGSRSPQINHVILAILSLARRRSWHLSAAHIEGVRNVQADALSRTAPLESEWMLDRLSFQFILTQVPTLQIDLFATSANHQLPLYVAPNVDPHAVGTDALSLDWNRWQSIYLFPPVKLLFKVLHKLRSFRGTAAIVAPLWPKSNWFPLVTELQLRLVPLPRPTLSQTVQVKHVYASSWLTEKLHLMIFSS